MAVHWPLTYSRDAPRFASDHFGFDAFFDNVDELGNRATASELERMQWACRYAGAESESWKFLDALTTAGATFTTFRDQVRTCYPHLDLDHRWSFDDLEDLLARTRSHSSMSREDLGRYYRSFVTISNYLVKRTIISKKQQGRLYLSGFPHSTRLALARRLEITCPNVIPSDGYNFEDVHECAAFVLIVREASVFIERDPSPLSSEQASLEELVQVMAQSFASVVQNPPPVPPYPQSSFRSSQTCAFCSSPVHLIRDCPIVSEYHRQGRIMRNEYGKIILPDGRLPPRNGPGRNLQERVDYFWEFQCSRANDNHSHEGASTHFLEIQDDCGMTMNASVFGPHTVSEPPTVSPDAQEKIWSLQAQIEQLRSSSKRVSRSLHHRAPHQVPSSRRQPSQSIIYSRPLRSVDEVSMQCPPYSMIPIPMPPRPSDEYKVQYPAADDSRTPELTHEAFLASPEYGDEFQRHQGTRSEDSAVNFRW